MEINLKHITVEELTKGYNNCNEEGVTGYDGLLNIRPAYQREFVYNIEKQQAVVTSVKYERPLNVMYWADNEDGTFEVLDGQQRTLSICEYVDGAYSIDNRYFHNLTKEEKEQILNYKILVYFCKGTASEKLEWFKIINIAGMALTNQELLNAVYTGQWLNDSKKHFSKTGCPAYQIGSDYVTGTPIRQDLLETALKWKSKNNIADYMAKHQHDVNANELWLYFTSVINWVRTVFPTYRKEMKGLDWGKLYDNYHTKQLDSKALEAEIISLMKNEDVTKKKGIYDYVLSREEKYLSIRSFTTKQKREAFERQGGICPKCNKKFELADMEGDHITPFSEGGVTTSENLQMLCKKDNRLKSNK